jgi:ribulose-phosphate 3-epimerase
MKGLISASMMCANLIDLKETLQIFEEEKVDYLHIDVMDGEFVPNFGLGVDYIRCLRELTDIPLDIHLMIDRPARYIKDFAKYADWLGFHYEAGSDVNETLDEIHALGVKTCLTIKPKTPAEAIFPYLPKCDMVLVMSVEPGFGGQSFMPSALDKLRALRQERDRLGLNILLEVDGGVNEETGKLCVEAGADVLVVGSALFKAQDLKAKASEYMSI